VTGRLPERTPRVPPINYARIPVMASGLLLLMFLPGIIEQGKGTYHNATGQTQAPFLGRWILITAALFGVSALAYAVKLLLVRRTSIRDEPSSGEVDGVEHL